MKVKSIVLLGGILASSLFANSNFVTNNVDFNQLKKLSQETGNNSVQNNFIKIPDTYYNNPVHMYSKKSFFIQNVNYENYNVYVKNNEIYFFYTKATNNLKDLVNILNKFNTIKSNKECQIKYKIFNNGDINKVIIKGKCKNTEKNYNLIEKLFRHNLEKEFMIEEKQMNNLIKKFENFANQMWKYINSKENQDNIGNDFPFKNINNDF